MTHIITAVTKEMRITPNATNVYVYKEISGWGTAGFAVRNRTQFIDW